MVEQNQQAAGGHVDDSVFPSNYVKGLQPALLSFVAATAGFPPPEPDSSFAYLELGCGSGATLNVLAAANPDCRFFGVDFNASAIAMARSDAHQNAVTNVTYIVSPFEELSLGDLPEFDYIVIHGTYSFLAPSALESVHDIVDRKLRDGGLFYVNYLCAPKRASVDPIPVLIREITRGIEGTKEERVEKGMEVLKDLCGADNGYFANTPLADRAVARDWRRIRDGMPNFLKHFAERVLSEYQRSNYFHEVQTTFNQIGLRFAGSNSTLRNDPALCIPADLQAVYHAQESPTVRELIKDYLLNEEHRSDVFIRADDTNESAARDYVRKNVFVFSMAQGAAIRKNWMTDFKNWRTRHEPNSASDLILECIDLNVSAFREIEERATDRDVQYEALVQALNLLMDRSDFYLCRKALQLGGWTIQLTSSASDALKRSAAHESGIASGARMVLASPVLGAGLVLGDRRTLLLNPAKGDQVKSKAESAETQASDNAAAADRRRSQEARLMSKLAQLEIVK